MVVPSAIRPRRVVAFARNSMASASEVLPTPWWATRATFRICGVLNSLKRHLPEGQVNDSNAGRGGGTRDARCACNSVRLLKLSRDFEAGQASGDARCEDHVDGWR